MMKNMLYRSHLVLENGRKKKKNILLCWTPHDTYYVYYVQQTLFTTPEDLSFWEFFSDRVVQFKKATAKLNPDELLELVHEPLGEIHVIDFMKEKNTTYIHTLTLYPEGVAEASQIFQDVLPK
jgi:hypothetical protein